MMRGNYSPLEVILLAEVVADLDQHGDAFGIAGFGDRGVTGLGAEFPGVAVAEHRDHNAVGTIGMNLQFARAIAISSASVLAGLPIVTLPQLTSV